MYLHLPAHGAAAGPGQADDLAAVEADAAACRGQQAHDGAAGRGLAAADSRRPGPASRPRLTRRLTPSTARTVRSTRRRRPAADREMDVQVAHFEERLDLRRDRRDAGRRGHGGRPHRARRVLRRSGTRPREARPRHPWTAAPAWRCGTRPCRPTARSEGGTRSRGACRSASAAGRGWGRAGRPSTSMRGALRSRAAV